MRRRFESWVSWRLPTLTAGCSGGPLNGKLPTCTLILTPWGQRIGTGRPAGKKAGCQLEGTPSLHTFTSMNAGFCISHCAQARGEAGGLHRPLRSGRKSPATVPRARRKSPPTVPRASSAQLPVRGPGSRGTHRHGVVEGVVVDAGTQRVVEHAVFKQLQGLRHLFVEVICRFIRTCEVEIV